MSGRSAWLSMKSGRVPTSAFVLAIALLLACDPANNVSFENGTGQAVTLYPQGLNVPSTARTLPPGGRYTEGMLSARGRQEPNAKLWQFAARGPEGEIVFCRAYSYADLQRDRFLVIVRTGVREC
jgi:hypothetical protein